MSELSIKIKIGNREYPMRVKAEDEERIRMAGKLLNEKIRVYQSQFGIDDMVDLISMVAFDAFVESLKKEQASEVSDEFAISEIKRLNDLFPMD